MTKWWGVGNFCSRKTYRIRSQFWKEIEFWLKFGQRKIATSQHHNIVTLPISVAPITIPKWTTPMWTTLDPYLLVGVAMHYYWAHPIHMNTPLLLHLHQWLSISSHGFQSMYSMFLMLQVNLMHALSLMLDHSKWCIIHYTCNACCRPFLCGITIILILPYAYCSKSIY